MLIRNNQIPVVISAALIFLFCSNTQQAGGAGAGNPATLSVVMSGALDSIEYNPIRESSRLQEAPFTVSVEDSASLRIDIDGAWLTVEEFSIPLEGSDFIIEDSLPAQNNSEAETFHSGPFVFDLLAGSSFPLVDFRISSGNYEYITLFLRTEGSSCLTDSVRYDSSICYQLLISGTFANHDTVQKIYLHALIDSTVHITVPGDIPLTITGSDSVHLAVVLDETEWLKGISIKGALKKGDIVVDDTGALHIYDNPTHSGPGPQLVQRLAANLFTGSHLRSR